MKKMFFKEKRKTLYYIFPFFCFSIILGIILFSEEVYALDDEEMMQEAVKAVALDFYYKERSLQYEDYSINFQGIRRDRSNLLLEDITTQNVRHTSCSSFATNVFYEAILDNNNNKYKFEKTYTSDLAALADENSNTYNENIAVYYKKLTGNETEEEKEEIYNDIINNIKAGDIIVTRSNVINPDENHDPNVTNGGHARLYLGNGVVIHSTGDYYNFSDKRDVIENKKIDDSYDEKYNINAIGYGVDNAGSVRLQSLENYTLTDQAVLKSSVRKIVILRPINEGNGISSKAQALIKYPKLVRSKVASVNKYDSVNLGDEIEYTIKLDNKSSVEYDNIVISDKIPNNTEFVSATGNYDYSNSKLTWTTDVPAGTTVEVSYKVRVGTNKNVLGTTIVSDSTVAAEMPLAKIETMVKNTLTKSEQEKIVSLIDKVGSSYNSTEEFLSSIYTDFAFPSVQELFNLYFTTESKHFDRSSVNSYNPVYLQNKESFEQDNNYSFDEDIYVLKSESQMEATNNTFGKMYIKDLYGGIYTTGVNQDINNDTRNLSFGTKTFMIGDVLLIYDEKNSSFMAGEKNIYLYAGDNNFLTVKDGRLILLNDKNSGGRSAIIDSLIGQNSFIALRPSFAMVRNIPVETDDEDMKDFINPKTGGYIYFIVMIAFIISLALLINKKKIVNKISL